MAKELMHDLQYNYLRFKKLPTKEEIEKYYKEEFYSTKYTQFNDSNKDNKEKDRDFNRARYSDYFTIIESFLGKLEGKSVFDYGCGFGEFLFFAKEKGLNVAGLEVAEEAVDYLKSQGISVILADINLNLSQLNIKEKFHIVTLFNVLEHLENPAQVLIDIRENLLLPDGILVVDVPNEFNPLQVTANSIYGLNEWWISYPVHINYFSVDSLKYLLEATGYVVKDSIASFPLEMFLLMGEKYVGNPALGFLCHQKRCLFEQNLRDNGKTENLIEFYRALAKCNMGRQIICFASPDNYMTPVAAKQLER